MKTINETRQYKKDLAKLQSNTAFKYDEMQKAVNILASGQKLPKEYYDHGMLNQKLYKGSRNFHLMGNMIVLYKMDKSEVTLMRIGSHSALLGKEKCHKPGR